MRYNKESMNFNKISIAVVVIATITACSTTKKTIKPTNTPPLTSSSSKPSVIDPFNVMKPSNGIFAPGNNELTAMQSKDNSITMQTLKEGYSIYTGTCTNCHQAVNIYTIREEAWPHILDNMALKARITTAQKNAVNKYVLAIKATQPK